MDLRVRQKTENGVAIVELSGEIELHSAPQLRGELVRANECFAPPCVVVDLSDATFIDSTGIGVLVGGLKRAREAGGQLRFCGARQRVHRVFEITGLLAALPLDNSCAESLAALQEPKEPADV